MLVDNDSSHRCLGLQLVVKEVPMMVEKAVTREVSCRIFIVLACSEHRESVVKFVILVSLGCG